MPGFVIAVAATIAMASGAHAQLLIPALCDALETKEERAACYMSHPASLLFLQDIANGADDAETTTSKHTQTHNGENE